MSDIDEKIEYSPEELAEIERITGSLPGGRSDEAFHEAPAYSLKEDSETAESEAALSVEDVEPAEETGEVEPVDELDSLTGGDDAFTDLTADSDSGLDSELSFPDDLSSLEGDDKGLEDITDRVQEVSGGEMEPASELDLSAPEEDFSAGDVEPVIDFDDQSGLETEPEIDTSDLAEGPGFEEEPPAEPSADKSTLDQLDEIISDEPEAIDDYEVSDDALVGMDSVSTAGEKEEEIPLDSIEPETGHEDIPNLDDIPAEGINDVPETEVESIDNIDFDNFDIEPIDDKAEPVPAKEDGAAAAIDLDAGVSLDLETETPEVEPVVSTATHDTDFIDDSIEQEFQESMASTPPPTSSDTSIDLSEKELKKLKKALLLMPVGLMNAVKEAILHDLLPADETRKLIDMILQGSPEGNIHRYLERKLHRKIDKAEGEGSKKRVLYSRQEYTAEGKDRQKKLLRRTAILGSIFLVLVVTGILTYIYYLKPTWARGDIDKGVKLITRKADSKVKDFKEAEDIFAEVNRDFDNEYIEGYRRYGEAYFNVKEYGRSLAKLNRAYQIDPANIDTLNSLGYVYSKMPVRFFKSIEPNLKTYYYQKIPPLGKIDSPLNVSIDFYRKSLNLKPDNSRALFGIGNAYLYQGDPLSAKKYYEDILKHNSDSVPAHSGLLNLYIEQDNFPELVSVYVACRDKEILIDIPLALQGKLAEYFISKSRTDKRNVRIDYGIESARLKDNADNLFPAVQNVLQAMHRKNPEYPPLYFHYARLAEKKGNLKLVQRNLINAIERAEDNNQNYFDAYHMLGKFYYKIKDPVMAVKYLRKAHHAIDSPADFTFDEYYQRTQNPGETYALEGNIFYYFFDKVKFRYGDIENSLEAMSEEDKDAMANYLIARKKYEEAVKAGFSSSELHYNLGRIYYMEGLYEKSLNQWLNLFEEFTRSPELMFALGNAYYKSAKDFPGRLDAAKAQYMKIITLFEYKAQKINKINTGVKEHIKVFDTLKSAYNNLGVVYQVENDEVKSNVSYWKSIEYAKKINQESELARINLSRSFKKRNEPITPLLDENIPYSIDIYRKEMR